MHRGKERQSSTFVALVGRVHSFVFKMLLNIFRFFIISLQYLHHFVIYAYSLITPPCFYSPGNEFHISLDDELEAIYLSLEHKQKKIIQHHLEKRKRFKLLLISFVLLFLAFKLHHHDAHASSGSASLGVTASVSSTCKIYSAQMAFGTYDPTSNTDLNVNGDVLISCTKNTSATITMDNGTYSSHANGTTRAMQNTGGGGPSNAYLSYELYKNSGLTSVWSVSNPLSITATTSAQTAIPIYGKIPNSQNVQTGGYLDTVMVTPVAPE